MRRVEWLCLVGLLFAAVGAARGQTIIAADGNATFTYNNGAVPTNATGIGGGSSNLDINGSEPGGGQSFETWWWYRVEGVDAREYRYSASSNPFVVSGDTMSGTFVFERFRSDLTYLITDADGAGTDSAHLLMRNIITNTSDQEVAINIFSYADLDVRESPSNAYQYSSTFTRFEVFSFLTTAYFQGFSALAHQAAPFTTIVGNGIRGLLADADVDDLNYTVVGSPGDFTGAFQFIRYLQPGESSEIYAALSVRDFPIPSPGAAGLGGLCGVVCAGRVRRR